MYTDKWSPALQIRTVLLSIQGLLSAPNPDDPLANDVADQWKTHESKAIETGTYMYMYSHIFLIKALMCDYPPSLFPSSSISPLFLPPPTLLLSLSLLPSFLSSCLSLSSCAPSLPLPSPLLPSPVSFCSSPMDQTVCNEQKLVKLFHLVSYSACSLHVCMVLLFHYVFS